MHKLECSAICAFGEKWCPTETVRLVARIINKLVNMKCLNDSSVGSGVIYFILYLLYTHNSSVYVFTDIFFVFTLKKVQKERSPSEKLLLLKDLEGSKF